MSEKKVKATYYLTEEVVSTLRIEAAKRGPKSSASLIIEEAVRKEFGLPKLNGK